MLETDAEISVDRGSPYVSRGGEKLAAALEAFELVPAGWVCADVGASTGGFTDCLIQHGAIRVYAVDVGRGQLHWKLRNDPKVISMEKTNARALDALPESVLLATVDASFISLRLLLPQVVKWLEHDGQIVVLIKPQFEAGKEVVGKGGVVRDPDVQRQTIESVFKSAVGLKLWPTKLIRSPLVGPKGNVEFLALLTQSKPSRSYDELLKAVF